MVQCTAPFVKPDSYRKAYQELQRRDDSTVFAAHLSHSFLWQRENEKDDDSNWLPINHPFHERVGRQFSKFQQVHETGAFYGFAVTKFLQAGHRFFSKAYPVLIEGDEIIDINDLSDWKFAQFKVSEREKQIAN
jgi:N-acylneuraminate cytidylyltransferase